MRRVDNKKTREKHFIIFTNKDAKHEGIWLDLDSTNSVFKSYDGDECNKGEITTVMFHLKFDLSSGTKISKKTKKSKTHYCKLMLEQNMLF